MSARAGDCTRTGCYQFDSELGRRIRSGEDISKLSKKERNRLVEADHTHSRQFKNGKVGNQTVHIKTT